MERITVRAAADILLVENRKVLLVKRAVEPFKGSWVLPGGHMDAEETFEETAVREMQEETGLEVEVEQLVGVYSDPNRDPRGRVVSACFAVKRTGGELEPGTDAGEAKWFPLDDLPALGFDHSQMIEDYKKSRYGK